MECHHPNTECPCPLLRTINGESFCGASHGLEEVVFVDKTDRQTVLSLGNSTRATCPNRILERSFEGQDRVMCCEKTLKPITIGKSILTRSIYRKAMTFAVNFSGSATICPECIFKAILRLKDPQLTR
ncbi:MAG: hypothetical protein ACE5OZ_22035 [Candidatus Heimdallarchaeota archaeon]